MSGNDNGARPDEHARKPPQTAIEEVIREVEEAETRDPEDPRERRHRGEAGDATSPNTGAQEQSHHD
ncbi:hypothetical protein [Streptomyces fumanus]|uniref:Uncharacterized protein n=1 Tax=Streptomyces fumanus TaxID=67302 RepID=A0A919E1G6_9ACTN|nr:hypothetical protein [Streptomyces fumanus]GHF00344.1 hypothetical protein GCM10018772_26180 [Streptomyces fumanus]